MDDSVEVGGRTRTFTVVGEVGPAGSGDLILIFHGSKQNGAKHRKFTGGMFDVLAEDHAAVVAYLDGYRGNWNDARRGSHFPARREDVDDVGFARAVIERLADRQGRQWKRVFAVGYSNGGQMVMRLAHEAPGLLAGAAVIAATLPAPENFLLPGAVPAAAPLLLIHGTKDPIVAYQGGELSWWARKVFKVGGRSLSIPDTATYFASHNGITTQPTTTALPRPVGAAGGTWVELTAYHQEGRPPVALHTVHGGGHTLPGPRKAPFVLGRTNQDINTAEVLADFFDLP